MNGHHLCSEVLNGKLDRAKWLIRQLLDSLPSNKDWLDPDTEHEMRVFSNSYRPTPQPETPE